MADIAVDGANVVSLSKSTAAELPAGVAVAQGNVAVLTPATGTQFKGRYMLVRIVESGATNPPTVTAKAGVTTQTPANLADLGDLDLGANWTAAGAEDVVVQLELARFQQADGTVRLDVSGGSGAEVTVSVVNLTKNA